MNFKKVYVAFQGGSRLVIIVFFDICPEEDCSPAVETSALNFDDEFVKPIRGW